MLQEWLCADGFPRRPGPEFADGRGIKTRIDREGLAVVLRECVGEPVIRVEEEASRACFSGGRLNTSKAESGGNERGSGIEISDFVQITTRGVHRRSPHCRGNSVIGRGAVNAGTQEVYSTHRSRTHCVCHSAVGAWADSSCRARRKNGTGVRLAATSWTAHSPDADSTQSYLATQLAARLQEPKDPVFLTNEALTHVSE